jgi:hypothetical protein
MNAVLRAWGDLPADRVAFTIQHVPLDALRGQVYSIPDNELWDRILSSARGQCRQALPDLPVRPAELVTVTYLNRAHEPVGRTDEAAVLLRVCLYMTAERIGVPA